MDGLGVSQLPSSSQAKVPVACSPTRMSRSEARMFELNWREKKVASVLGTGACLDSLQSPLGAGERGCEVSEARCAEPARGHGRLHPGSQCHALT